MHRRTPFVVLLYLFASSSAKNSDSLAYYKVRDSLLASVPFHTEAVVQAADELAAEGLYREALSMLTELPKRIESDSIDANRKRSAENVSVPAAAPMYKEQEPPLPWRITGAADYTHLEDIIILDPEKKDALGPQREEPFTISSKAAFSWKPRTRAIRSLDPSLSISNQKAALDFSAGFFIAPMLEIDAGMKAEKRLVNTGSAIMGGNQRTVFKGDREDSLDMVGGRIAITPGCGDESSKIKWEAPLTAEASRYQHGRGGYYSFNDFQLAPTVSFVTGDMRKHGSLRFFGEYKDFMSGTGETVTRADSFDVYRLGPEVSGDMWRQGFSATATVGFLYERYLHRAIPSAVRTLDAEMQFRLKPRAGLEALLQVQYEYRNEFDKGIFNYLKDTIILYNPMPGFTTTKDSVMIRSMYGSIPLDGHEIEVSPAMRWSPFTMITIELRCPILIRSYSVVDTLNGCRLSAPLFIIESREAFEPELGFDYSGRAASIRVSGAYVIENIPPREYYTLSSNRGWKAHGDCMVRLSKRISFYTQVEYQHRGYAPYRKDSRKSTNLTAAAGFSARF